MSVRTATAATWRAIVNALLPLALALAATSAAAEEAEPAAEQTPLEQMKAVWERELLTGDWEGWRTRLQEHGIDPHFRLAQYGQWVADGGNTRSSAYGGTMDYRVNLDLRKLFGMWEGLRVDMHARTRFGEGLGQNVGAFALQNAGMLMPLPGKYTGTDVTGLTVTQYLPFFYDRLALVSLGKLDVIDTVHGFFPEIVGYGQEGFWNVNALVTALPWFGAVDGLSLYGGIAATVNQEYGAIESGFLATGTEGVSDNWGTLQDSFEDGVWLAGFHRFFWKLEDKPGFFLVFAAGSTRKQASNDPRDWTVIPGQGITSTNEKRPWDVAMYIKQVLWQAEEDPGRKVTFFVGGTVGPDDPQFAQYHLFGAIEAFGILPSRGDDRMGVAAWKNWLSNDYKDLVSPVADLRDTWGVEIYYNIALNQWLHLTPDLQLIQSEAKGTDLAIVPGIRLVIDF